jgi:hypothetical protein
VNLVSGGLIEIEDYNEIALEVNRLFSDNTVNLTWNLSDIVLDYEVTGAALGSGSEIPFDSANLNLSTDDYLVVIINEGDSWFTIGELEYTIDYSANPEEISFSSTYGIGTRIRVYNRTDHRYGWGQQASVYPVAVGDPVLADEAVLQAYLEANVNNLIDKVNIMEERTDGPSELTRIAQGQLIFATDKTTITSTINADILSGQNYWKNEVATLTTNVASQTRTAPWTTELTGSMRWTWDSYDSFRYFFNSGCDLRATLVPSGSTNNQGFVNWTTVIDRMGSLILNYDTCLQTGSDGTSEEIGAYELTGDWQRVFISAGNNQPVGVDPSEYLDEYDEYLNFLNLRIVWEARTVINVPDSGNIAIDIRARLDDREFAQTFEGELEYQAGYRVADDVTDNSAVFSMTDNIPDVTDLEPWTASNASPPATIYLAQHSDFGFAEGQSIGNNFGIDVGDMTINFEREILGNSGTVTYDGVTTTYVNSPAENYNSVGTLKISGSGSGPTAKIIMTFVPDVFTAVNSIVEDLSFRVSGIDGAGPEEQVTVEAFDGSGDPVNISFTTGSNLSESSGVVTANNNNGTADQAAHSVLMYISSPVARVEVTVACNDSAIHEVFLSDVAFQTIPI